MEVYVSGRLRVYTSDSSRVWKGYSVNPQAGISRHIRTALFKGSLQRADTVSSSRQRPFQKGSFESGDIGCSSCTVSFMGNALGRR